MLGSAIRAGMAKNKGKLQGVAFLQYRSEARGPEQMAKRIIQIPLRKPFVLHDRSSTERRSQ
jgi:hypothetical protein